MYSCNYRYFCMQWEKQLKFWDRIICNPCRHGIEYASLPSLQEPIMIRINDKVLVILNPNFVPQGLYNFGIQGKFGEDKCCSGGGLPRALTSVLAKKMSRVHLLLLFWGKKNQTPADKIGYSLFCPVQQEKKFFCLTKLCSIKYLALWICDSVVYA